MVTTMTTTPETMTTSDDNLNPAEKLGDDNHDNLNRVSETRIGKISIRSLEIGGEVVTVVTALEFGRTRDDNPVVIHPQKVVTTLEPRGFEVVTRFLRIAAKPAIQRVFQ